MAGVWDGLRGQPIAAWAQGKVTPTLPAICCAVRRTVPGSQAFPLQRPWAGLRRPSLLLFVNVSQLALRAGVRNIWAVGCEIWLCQGNHRGDMKCRVHSRRVLK